MITKIYNFLEVVASFDLAPAKAIEYFAGKGLRESFDWRDMIGQDHDAAFTVAKMMDTDLLSTVHEKLTRALEQGTTFEQFARELMPQLQKAGWWGKKDVIDPLTGKLVSAQLGSASRLETIFRSNLQSAYSVGRWNMVHRNAKTAPYLLYDAVDDHRTRPEHARWDGTVLPVGNAFWLEFMPPNGWNCRCGVIQLSEDDLKDYGLKVSKPPKIKRRRWVNPRTGKPSNIPTDVDPGWNTNPGANRLVAIKETAEEKRKVLTPEQAAAVAKTPEVTIPDVPLEDTPVFKAARTKVEAEQWVLKGNYAQSVDFGKMDIRVINEVNEALFEQVRDFPELGKNLEFVGSAQVLNRKVYESALNFTKFSILKKYPELTDSEAERWAKKYTKRTKTGGEWAFARKKSSHESMRGLSGVAFNEKFASARGYDDLAYGLERSLEGNFHPVGTDTIKSIMDHELGHQLDYLLNLRKDSEIIALHKEWGGDPLMLSYYARTNLAEFIAEAWAEYRNNPSPRDIAKRLGEIIYDRYSKRYP